VLENDPAFNVLRGGVLTLLGRTAEARKDFSVHALANDPDAALWRGLLDTADKNWEAALQSFSEGSDRINSYRPDLQARFRLAAIRSALALRRLKRAAEELEALPKTVAKPALHMESQLLKGRYLENTGRNEEALEAYDAVLKSDQRPAVAEAELRTIRLLLRNEQISRADAIKNLERLQLVWRGDDTELGTMRLLTKLYVQDGRYRDAFTIMKNAIMTYPQSRQAILMQDEMKQVFKDLFLTSAGNNLPPVRSLALYYDFRELTPVGRQGDEMIRRLADQLIEFDLLDQAAEVLDHQVNKRLKGAARSQVATRLAMVHLMNHKPELALRIIRQTRQAGLPNELQRSRNLLEARALGELGRAEAAIEILNTIKGADVEQYKADALWSSQQWQRAGEQLESLLGVRWQNAEPLGDRERFDVLRSAIAYSLAGDQFALDRLRQKFYEKMVKTPDAGSFLVVTRPIKSQGVSFRDLAKQIAATDTLNAFMKEFRKRHDTAPEPARTGANTTQQGQSG
jgi:tetratricopeptide (TPR) repeat protein